MSDPTFVPTKRQIREACRRIQAGWSELEKLDRYHGDPKIRRPKRNGSTAPSDDRRQESDDADRDADWQERRGP